MKAWQQAYTAEQTALAFQDDPVVTARYLHPCGNPTVNGASICRKAYYCQQVDGHPGQCSRRLTTCNRPAGHDGPHAFMDITRHGYEQLAAWT